MKKIIFKIFLRYGILPHQIGERLLSILPINKILLHLLIERILSGFFGRRSANFSIQNHREVIVVFPGQLGIGDVLMLSPIIGILQRSYGEKFSVATDFDCIFEEHQSLWRPLSYLEVGARQGALIIFPTFSFRNLSLLVKYRFSYLGYLLTEELTSNCYKLKGNSRIQNTNHYFERLGPILLTLGIETTNQELCYPKIEATKIGLPEGPYVLMAPYAVWAERRASLHTFKRAMEKYFDASHRLIIVGAALKGEIEYCELAEKEFGDIYNVTNLVGKTTLSEFQYLSNAAAGYIGNDVGPSQLSSLSDCKKIIILDGCVPYKLRISNPEKPHNKILFYNKALRCPFYPCFNGYERPKCVNPKKHWCLPAEEDI